MSDVDPVVAARSRACGDAIQAIVAADPDLSMSTIGMALDGLSTMLRNSPDSLPSMAGWIDLIGAIRAYIMDGTPSDLVTELLRAGGQS